MRACWPWTRATHAEPSSGMSWTGCGWCGRCPLHCSCLATGSAASGRHWPCPAPAQELPSPEAAVSWPRRRTTARARTGCAASVWSPGSCPCAGFTCPAATTSATTAAAAGWSCTAAAQFAAGASRRATRTSSCTPSAEPFGQCLAVLQCRSACPTAWAPCEQWQAGSWGSLALDMLPEQSLWGNSANAGLGLLRRQLRCSGRRMLCSTCWMMAQTGMSGLLCTGAEVTGKEVLKPAATRERLQALGLYLSMHTLVSTQPQCRHRAHLPPRPPSCHC